MRRFQWSVVIVGLLCAVIWLGCGNDDGDDATIADTDDATLIAQIAFDSKRDGNSEIYVMTADGGNVVKLTNNEAFDGSPAWRHER